MTEVEEHFISLVRLGIGETANAPIIDTQEWDALMSIASSQRLSSIALDGLNSIIGIIHPPQNNFF